MNLNINTAAGSIRGGDISVAGNETAARMPPPHSAAPDFTITKAAVSPEELKAALLPASTLLRDDSLGKLFAQAFNLPPPPIPDFKNLS